jgi:hypothetical protein
MTDMRPQLQQIREALRGLLWLAEELAAPLEPGDKPWPQIGMGTKALKNLAVVEATLEAQRAEIEGLKRVANEYSSALADKGLL